MQTLKITKKYQKYPEYKDSGVEWFGNIPKGWGVGPVRSVLSERVEKNTGLVNGNILSVMKDVGVIRYADKGDIGNKSSDRPENYKLVYPEDIVLNSMNLVIGSVGQAKEMGVTSSVYIIYYPKNKEVNADYYHYLFRDKSWQKTLGRLGRGIMELRESIKPNDLKIEPVPVPTIEDQIKIAKYLDEKIAFIDQIIEKKQKLIDLLREKRTAVINQAVTKGLDKNVDLKNSLFGNISSEWQISKFRNISKLIKTGSTPSTSNNSYFEGDMNWFTPGDFNNENLIESNRKISEEAIINGECRLFPAKSVLLVSIGATLGKVSYSEKDFSCNQQINVISPNNKMDYKYVYYFISAYPDFIKSNSLVTTIGILNQNRLKNMEILVPPIMNQVEISKYLDEISDNTRKIMVAIEKSIELLKEFKSALISNVVTGKIKIN